MTTRQRIKQRLMWNMRDCGSLPVGQFNMGCCEWLDRGVLFAPGSEEEAEIDRMDKACTLARLFTEVRKEVKHNA